MVGTYLGALIALGVVAVLSAIGITITRDNLYAAIYLAITTGLVGAIYGLFGITYGFILIYLVFVGATITITIVLAATYRRVEFRGGGVGKSWVIPMLLFVIAIIVASVWTNYSVTPVSGQSLVGFLSSPNDLLLVVLLSALLMTIMIGLIMYYLEVGGRWR